MPRPASSGATAITADGARVFTVNPDSGTVSAVATATRTKLAETAVGAEPATLALTADGASLLVTSRAAGTLTVLDASTLTPVSVIPVGAEPYGVVADPLGRLAYVAASVVDAQASPPTLRGVVRVVDLARGGVVATVHVEAKPMGLAVDAAGTRLYATHFLTGRVSVIDLGARPRAVRKVISTGVDSNMAQKIVLHPASGRAYLPHIQSNLNDPSFRPELTFDETVFPVVSVIDLASETHLPLARLHLDLPDRAVGLPFDLAVAPDGARLYVVGFGSDDLAVVDLAQQRVVGHVDTGDGPRGLALSPDGTRAWVGHAFSHDVAVVNLRTLERVERITVTTAALSPRLALGRRLFFSSRPRRISSERWMSCASCHFDGDHDGRTWFFPGRGFRNTTTLLGTRDTAPFHWSADRDELQDFELTIRELQAGLGLIRNGVPHPPLGASNAGRSADLDALAAFIRSLPPRPSPFLIGEGWLTAAARRGRTLFERGDVGCARCHPAPRFTDRTRHDVGTGDGPHEGLGPRFDTPSLRMLWNSAPYLHDGSAATLREVLRARNRDDRHGTTSHLTSDELDDLIAYLRSL